MAKQQAIKAGSTCERCNAHCCCMTQVPELVQIQARNLSFASILHLPMHAANAARDKHFDACQRCQQHRG